MQDQELQVANLDAEIKHCLEQIPEYQPVEIKSDHRKPRVLLSKWTEITAHNEKAYDLCWFGEKNQNLLVSVGADGQVMILNQKTGEPVCKWSIIGQDSWIMSCAVEQSVGELIAVAGATGKVNIFQVQHNREGITQRETPLVNFDGHNGYIPACKFLTPSDFLTVGSDQLIKIWKFDADNHEPIVLSGHTEDILCADGNNKNSYLFLTGGCDHTAKFWDVRDRQPLKRTYRVSDFDVNDVKFLPNSEYSFYIGSNDGKIYLMDLRALYPVQEFEASHNNHPVSSIDTSLSGRILFCGLESGDMIMWDVLNPSLPLQILPAHGDKLSKLTLSTAGNVLATVGYDSKICIWKPM